MNGQTLEKDKRSDISEGFAMGPIVNAEYAVPDCNIVEEIDVLSTQNSIYGDNDHDDEFGNDISILDNINIDKNLISWDPTYK